MGPQVQKNYSLADETTMKVGGPARLFAVAESRRQLEKMARKAFQKDTEVTILGGGSNVVVAAEGVDGLVIKLRGGEIELLEDRTDFIKLEAGAGVALPRLARFAYSKSGRGLEWSLGVPGALGGTIYNNAGAFGDSISEIVEEVEVLEGDKKRVLSAKEIDFGYRSSTFKKRDLIILSSTLKLEKNQKEEIKSQMDEYLEYRNNNHPMGKPSAGCIFKNPETKIEDEELIEKHSLLEEFNEKGMIPAGYLIEEAGLKGKTIGKAEVSSRHTNFIVNKKRQASAEDIKKLIRLIQKEVQDKFNLKLQREVRYIS